VIGHPQRHPATHRVPDQADGQLAETFPDPAESPPRVRHRGLAHTVPPTHGIPKRCERDAPMSGPNHAAAKGHKTQDSRVERANRIELVLHASMQEQHDGLGSRVIAAETQVGRV
jgi:hypothetical protein